MDYGGLLKDYFEAAVVKNIYFIWDQCQTMWFAVVFSAVQQGRH